MCEVQQQTKIYLWGDGYMLVGAEKKSNGRRCLTSLRPDVSSEETSCLSMCWLLRSLQMMREQCARQTKPCIKGRAAGPKFPGERPLLLYSLLCAVVTFNPTNYLGRACVHLCVHLQLLVLRRPRYQHGILELFSNVGMELRWSG